MVKAVGEGDIARVRELLAENVAVNCQDHYKRTAVGKECQCGNAEVLDLLITAKADLCLQNSKGRSPLILAVEHNEILEKLLENIPRKKRAGVINTLDDDGCSVLHQAVIRNNITGIKLLLKNKGDPDLRDGKGDTPLHIGKYYIKAMS